MGGGGDDQPDPQGQSSNNIIDGGGIPTNFERGGQGGVVRCGRGSKLIFDYYGGRNTGSNIGSISNSGRGGSEYHHHHDGPTSGGSGGQRDY